MADDSLTQAFLALSVTLTGFSEFELWGTGMVETYRDRLCLGVGDELVEDLVVRFRQIERGSGRDSREMEGALRREILSDPILGPVARSLIKLWYLGTWYGVPPGADASVPRHPHHGRRLLADRVTSETDAVVSAQAYVEGLAWKAMDTHPMGAKQPGFATWSDPPTSVVSVGGDASRGDADDGCSGSGR